MESLWILARQVDNIYHPVDKNEKKGFLTF